MFTAKKNLSYNFFLVFFVVSFIASMKDTKVSYISFSQPLFFSAESSVPLHKAAMAASVAVVQKGWSKYPAAQVAVDLKEGNSDNYGKFRVAFSTSIPYKAPSFSPLIPHCTTSCRGMVMQPTWWSRSDTQCFWKIRKREKLFSTWAIPEPSTCMNCCARRVDRADEKLRRDPGEESREPKGANTRTALEVKRLWLVALW